MGYARKVSQKSERVTKYTIIGRSKFKLDNNRAVGISLLSYSQNGLRRDVLKVAICVGVGRTSDELLFSLL